MNRTDSCIRVGSKARFGYEIEHETCVISKVPIPVYMAILSNLIATMRCDARLVKNALTRPRLPIYKFCSRHVTPTGIVIIVVAGHFQLAQQQVDVYLFAE